jgi:hypothetical protein
MLHSLFYTGGVKMSVDRNMYIRNVFGGKSLLDAKRDNVQYEIQPVPGGWCFKIAIQDKLTLNEILKFKSELNIFVTEEQQGEPLQKWWYYPKDGRVEYSEQDKLLSIFSESKLAYTPT